MASTSSDLLFGLHNNFHIGAYQAAINNSNVPNLSTDDTIKRDSLVYHSYIALGSYQLVIDEVDSSAPTALQAVKLLAIYLSGNKESAISSLQEWLSDAAIGNNPVLRLVAGIIYMLEQDYNEALKHTNTRGTMDFHSFQIKAHPWHKVFHKRMPPEAIDLASRFLQYSPIFVAHLCKNLDLWRAWPSMIERVAESARRQGAAHLSESFSLQN